MLKNEEQNSTLILDNLKIGDFVTVKRGEFFTPSVPVGFAGMFNGEVPAAQQIEDKGLNGMPLRIEAMNIPYILVTIMGYNKHSILDLRRWQIMPISKDYAEKATRYLSEIQLRKREEKNNSKMAQFKKMYPGLPYPE